MYKIGTSCSEYQAPGHKNVLQKCCVPWRISGQVEIEQPASQWAAITDFSAPVHAAALVQLCNTRSEVQTQAGAATGRIDALYVIRLTFDHLGRKTLAVVIDR